MLWPRGAAVLLVLLLGAGAAHADGVAQADSPDFTLDTRTILTPNWSSVVGTPDDNGTSRSVTLPAGPGNKFYRLKK
jgi:hypothetical protein